MAVHSCPSNPCPICHPANDAHKLAALILADRTRATPANPVAGGLVEQLWKAAQSRSAIQRQMAEAKSLRQEDNPERRLDLYSWPTPEQTLEGQAAIALEALGGGVEADEATVTFALDELDGSDFEAIRGHSKTLRAAIAAMKGQTNAD